MPARALPTEPAPRVPAAVSYAFPPNHSSVSRARAALRRQLALWRVAGDAADSALLLLSELATNAVRVQTKSGGDITVRFELTGPRLRLEVSDTSDAQPAQRDTTDDDVSGRGLILVDALADTWGVEPRGAAGKVVWAVLALPDGSVHAADEGASQPIHVMKHGPTWGARDRSPQRRTTTSTYESTEMKMTMNSKRQTAAEKLKEAETLRDNLSAALRAVGIVLPSLGVEPHAYGDEDPRPLIELGRCNQDTARKLTAALLKVRA